jgi:hypothetical protein
MRFDFEKAETYAAAGSAAYCDDYFVSREYVTQDHLMTLTSSRQVNLQVYFALYTEWIREIEKIRNPYFDYECESIKTITDTLMNALSHHVRINHSFFEPLLKKAIFDSLHFLFEPLDYLLRLLDSEKILATEAAWHAAHKFFVYHTEQMDAVFQDINLVTQERGSLNKNTLHTLLRNRLATYEPSVDYIESMLRDIAIVRPIEIGLLITGV